MIVNKHLSFGLFCVSTKIVELFGRILAPQNRQRLHVLSPKNAINNKNAIFHLPRAASGIWKKTLKH